MPEPPEPGRFAIPEPEPIPAPEPMPVLGRVLGNVDGRVPIELPAFGRLGRVPGCKLRLPLPMFPVLMLGRTPPVDGRVDGVDGRLNDGELPTEGRDPPPYPPLGRAPPPPP